jgi:hypothetical protein
MDARGAVFALRSQNTPTAPATSVTAIAVLETMTVKSACTTNAWNKVRATSAEAAAARISTLQRLIQDTVRIVSRSAVSSGIISSRRPCHE